MSRSRYALIALFLFAFGCSSLPSELEPFEGSFDYVALDENGDPLLEGLLVLDVKEGGSVTGSWQIDWAPNADQATPVGPQIGSGLLVGSIVDGDLTVNLNPGSADSNVDLQGTRDGEEITGTWAYVKLSGPGGTGEFTATKR